MTDDPTNWELHRALTQFRDDLREGLARQREDIALLRDDIRQMVPKEVFHAHQESVDQRMTAVETECQQLRKDRTADRRTAVSSLVGAVLSIITGVVLILARAGVM